MFHFLKNIFSTKDGSRTVLIVRDDGSKPSSSHRLHPLSLWLITIGFVVGLIVLVIVLIRFTPVGGLVYEQRNMRNKVIAIQHKVAAMGDTIQARNQELHQMQNVMASGKDTSFQDVSTTPKAAAPAQKSKQMVSQSWSKHHAVALLPANAKVVNNLFKNVPAFPASYPIEGANTRTFNIQTGHYGLDIAAAGGQVFNAIADGVIISEEWTFNFGYMIIVQHPGGIICIYKHAQTLSKDIGATVRRGDALGTIGEVGILSSGPHLHIEIWKNGIPQNPVNYLIKS